MLPVRLGDDPFADVDGLLDTGSAVNVLPWSVGVAVGLGWNAPAAPLALTGNLATVTAKAVLVTTLVGSYPVVQLVYAWVQSDAVPVLFGRVNFFQEFDVCFHQSAGAFEVRPRGTP
jgi:hypothetical protein